MSPGNRLLMVAFSTYPNDPRIRREAETLVQNGYHVDMICLGERTEQATEKIGSVVVYRIMKWSDEKETIKQYIYRTLMFTILALIYTMKLYIRKGYQIIHIHNMPDYLLFVGLLPKVLGAHLFLDLHDLSPELFLSKWGGRHKLLLKLVTMVEFLACRLSDEIITTSEGFKERLIQRGVAPNKITLVLNGADPMVFIPNKQRTFRIINKNLEIIYHGTVARRFGLHCAIKAIPLIREKIPSLSLQIFGKYDPQYRVELDAMIGSLKLEKIVKLNEYIQQEKLVEIIDNADIALVPYTKDEFMELALSTKSFEYASMEIPMVAARLKSICWLFDSESVEYFDPGDHSDMALKILKLCNAPDLRKRFVYNAKRCYEKISWLVMSKRYLSLVQRYIQ